MEDAGYEDIDSEEIYDDRKYQSLPLDWDPEADLLKSFDLDYLQDKTFDIYSNIFKRKDGLDLRPLNVRKRVIGELTGAKVNYKTEGYAKELYDNLTFDEDNKSILYKGEEIQKTITWN